MPRYSYFQEKLSILKNQVENKEFRITVVGEFSAGKSTFLNALIGLDILPHAVTETTATITYIHNVSIKSPLLNKVIVHFFDNNKKDLELDISNDKNILKHYVTVKSDKVESVSNEISSVDIYVNFRNTDENIVFIDTPGFKRNS